MKLYNTSSKQVEEIKPLNPPTVTIYTCGPTVYDYPHVGNWFTYIREDILIRALKLADYDVRWVMNITDVGHLTSDADEGQDKLEKGAEREGLTAWDIADRYTGYFKTGMERLNISKPTHMPKATDNIQEQIDFIKVLEGKGYTYQIADGIYYDTSKFSRYADFAQLDLDEQQTGHRIQTNPEKRQPTDFALWKFSPTDYKRDMEWDSPWGKGFPGWHIECSAMSMKYLGKTLDIHAGGIDHIPVHHSNEIAQSEAANQQPLANIWMHTNHITVDGQKIAKSLNNGITLEAIENQGISLEAFRLHVLESHYRSQSKFSWDSLKAAQNRLKSWQAAADMRWQALAKAKTIKLLNKDPLEPIYDDLATPQVLANIDELFGQLAENGIATSDVDPYIDYLKRIDQALGLSLSDRKDINAEQKSVIAQRESARQDKDWGVSDNLRNRLLELGLEVSDTPNGTIWSRL